LVQHPDTPTPFWIERRPAPEGTALLALGGELDLATSGRFSVLVDEVRAERPRVVVADFEQVSFIDSSMLRELLRSHRDLAGEGARLIVAAAQPTVRRLLELTGTASMFDLADTAAEGLARAAG
jgi:anti-anti-sigma factor